MHKPVQLGWLERMFVSYDGARIVHFACMLGLAYVMNYAGMTSTLGLALAATGNCSLINFCSRWKKNSPEYAPLSNGRNPDPVPRS